MTIFSFLEGVIILEFKDGVFERIIPLGTQGTGQSPQHTICRQTSPNLAGTPPLFSFLLSPSPLTFSSSHVFCRSYSFQRNPSKELPVEVAIHWLTLLMICLLFQCHPQSRQASLVTNQLKRKYSQLKQIPISVWRLLLWTGLQQMLQLKNTSKNISSSHTI